MRFAERLAALGFSTYADYLASDHWQDFRHRYFAAGQPSRCAVCGEVQAQLHHTTYKRLGEEQFSDVMPLCRDHHEAVHAWLSKKGHDVGKTGRAIESLRSKLPQKPKQERISSIKRKRMRNRQQRAELPKLLPPISSEKQDEFDTKHWEAKNAAQKALAKYLAEQRDNPLLPKTTHAWVMAKGKYLSKSERRAAKKQHRKT